MKLLALNTTKLTPLSTLTITLLFINYNSFTQYTPAYLSVPYTTVDAPHKYYLQKDNYLLTAKIDKEKLYLRRFNTDSLDILNTGYFEDMPKTEEVVFVGEINNAYYFLYSHWNETNKTEQLYSREIDFDNCAFKGEVKRIATISEELLGVPTDEIIINNIKINYGNTNKFKVIESETKENILICYRYKSTKKKDSEIYDKYGFIMLSNKMNPIWLKEYDMPFTKDRLVITDISVIGLNKIKLLASLREESSKKRILTSFAIDSNNIKLIDIVSDSAHYYLTDIKPINEKEQIEEYIGFYSKSRNGIYNHGILYGKQDSIDVYRSNYHEFSDEFLIQYTSTPLTELKFKRDKIIGLRIIQVNKCSDQGIILIGEERYEEKVSNSFSGEPTYAAPKTQTGYIKHFGKLIIAKYNNSGELQWINKIPKNQTASSNDIYALNRSIPSYSFIYRQIKNKHYIVYLDRPENLFLSINKSPSPYVIGSSRDIRLRIINDSTGNVQSNTLLDTKNVNGTKLYQVSPSRFIVTSNNELIFEAYKKKREDVLVKVKIE